MGERLEAFKQSSMIWDVGQVTEKEKDTSPKRFLERLALHNLEHDNMELVESMGNGSFLRGAKKLKEILK